MLCKAGYAVEVLKGAKSRFEGGKILCFFEACQAEKSKVFKGSFRR